MNEVGDDLLDTGPRALAAGQEDEAVAERRLGSSLHVRWHDVVAARGQRHGAGRLPERDGTALATRRRRELGGCGWR